MFGYITAERQTLPPEAIERYSACYCGLCQALSRRYGIRGRLVLTYDMAFLILLEHSLYEDAESTDIIRCPIHPLRSRPVWHCSFTDYAADMNLLLAYWNQLDDYEDEGKHSARFLANRLKADAASVEAAYPRQAQAIRDGLDALHRYESGPEASADRAADAFGGIMAELFAVRESDYWAPTLRRLGQGLGRLIYIMDACIDIRRDAKKGSPNPLLALGGTPDRSREDDYILLSSLLAECTAPFEHLPLVTDVGLMRNILYSGLWQKYNQAFRKRDMRDSPGKSESSR